MTEPDRSTTPAGPYRPVPDTAGPGAAPGGDDLASARPEPAYPWHVPDRPSRTPSPTDLPQDAAATPLGGRAALVPPAPAVAPGPSGAPQPSFVFTPAPPLFATTWPPPPAPAPSIVLLAAAASGLAAAAVLPIDRIGVGWFLLGMVLVAMTVLMARRVHPADAGRPAMRVVWTVAAAALLGVGAIRDAPWLFTLCVLTAFGAGSLAVAGGRSVRGLVAGAFAVPVAALRGARWAARGARTLRASGAGGTGRTVLTVLVTALLLAVFVPLLATADAGFDRIVDAVLPAVDGGSVFRWVLLFGLVGLGTLGAGFTLAAPPDWDAEPRRPRGRVRRIEWALPVGALVALFASFVVVQLTALFGGDDHVQRTTGLTYAEYARSGFWELLAVTVLTLGVIAAVARWAPLTTPGDRTWLRVLVGALALLTLVIVGSALSRMWAYQQAYGFTVLRLLVSACELWLGTVYLLVIAAVVRLRVGWVPQAVLATGVAALLALAALDPEGFIADRNVARYEDTGRIDIGYLAGLSADAAPALSRLPVPLRSCGLREIDDRLAAVPEEWRTWNLSRDRARALAADPDLFRDPDARCTDLTSTPRGAG